jgi:hypothetical protein
MKTSFEMPPPADTDVGLISVELSGGVLRRMNQRLGRPVEKYENNEFNAAQLVWISEGPLTGMEDDAHEFLSALDAVGQRALVPDDVWDLVMGA